MELTKNEKLVIKAMREGADVDVYFHSSSFKLDIIGGIKKAMEYRVEGSTLSATELSDTGNIAIGTDVCGSGAIEVNVFVDYENVKGANRMDKEKTEETVAVVKDDAGNEVGYLTAEHEEAGFDIDLDMQGYTVEAL